MSQELIKVRAYAKGVLQAPRKTDIVAKLIRGRSIDDALVILDHVPRRAALPVKKTLQSAKANAINNHNLDPNSLQLAIISVTIGKRLKRHFAAAKGRSLPYQKKTSNILIELVGSPKKATVKKAAKVSDKKTTTTVKKSAKKETK